MIAVYILGLIVAFALGACVEARLQTSALATERLRTRAWRAAAHRWHNRCNEHADVLRALGRVVAEGGSVVGPDARHPSQRRDEAA